LTTTFRPLRLQFGRLRRSSRKALVGQPVNLRIYRCQGKHDEGPNLDTRIVDYGKPTLQLAHFLARSLLGVFTPQRELVRN